MSTTSDIQQQHLSDLAELVSTGPVDLGAYTQAELSIVLGQIPTLGETSPEVMAEAVRSLAARGLLNRVPGQSAVDVVGDLGLVVALVGLRVGALEIRRGHPGPPDEPWRWLVSLYPNGLAGVDRIDALGLHRLSLLSHENMHDVLAEQLLGGKASIPRGGDTAIPVSGDEVRKVTALAPARWQLILRRPRPDGTMLVADALVLRSGEARVDLVTRTDGTDGYQRTAVDENSLRQFLTAFTNLR